MAPIDLDANFVTQHAFGTARKEWIDSTGRVWSSEFYCRACGKNCWDGTDTGSLRHHVQSDKHKSRVSWWTETQNDDMSVSTVFSGRGSQSEASRTIPPPRSLVALRSRSRSPIIRRNQSFLSDHSVATTSKAGSVGPPSTLVVKKVWPHLRRQNLL